MSPLSLPLKVYRGSPIAEAVTFTQPDKTPVDLTGLTPFKAEIRKTPGATLALELTVTCATPSEGRVEITATTAQTLTLAVGGYAWDMLDATGVKWLAGAVSVTDNITEL